MSRKRPAESVPFIVITSNMEDKCSATSLAEVTGNENLASSSPTSDVMSSKVKLAVTGDSVESQSNNVVDEEGESSVSTDKTKKKSSVKTSVNSDTSNSTTPSVTSSKSTKATTPVSTAKGKTPVDSTLKPRRAKVNNLTTTVANNDDEEVQTPVTTKTTKGAQKKTRVSASTPLPEPNTPTEDPKVRGRKKAVGLGGAEEPLFADDRLPEGWSRTLIQRQGGATAGKYDVYILSPQNRRFRSRNELRNFIIKESLDLQADDFDFSVCGKELNKTDTASPNVIPPAKKVQVKKRNVTPAASQETKSPEQASEVPQTPEPDKKIIKKKSVLPPTNHKSTELSDTGSPHTIPPIASAKKAIKRNSVVTEAVQKAAPPTKKKKTVQHAKKDVLLDMSDDAEEVSPYFSSGESKKSVSEVHVKPLIGSNKWTPPRSPYNLIQENLFHNPWQLLVATILLNKSLVLKHDITGKTATSTIYGFFDKWPTPESVGIADIKEIAKMIRPLGLQDKRANTIKRFSVEYQDKEWLYPKELHGIGKYGNDSYRMFCVNEWRAVNPTDTMLIMYKNWMITNWRHLCNNTNNCLRLPDK